MFAIASSVIEQFQLATNQIPNYVEGSTRFVLSAEIETTACYNGVVC